MRGWFLSTAVTVLVVGEVAVGPLLAADGGAGPDLLLPLVVYVALVAPRAVNPLFYLMLGLLSDLLSVPHPGLRGFSYVVVGLAVENVNPGTWRRNPFVQGVLAAVGSFCVEAVYGLAAVHNWPGGTYGALRVALHSALFTGLAALLLGWPLRGLSRLFNWPSSGAPASWAQIVAAAGAGTAAAPRRERLP
jgi:rod shape-determining protein MreD